MKMEKIRPFMEGKKVVKVIYVPGKLVNIVVS
jgi:leucyl-tRNA synthetase